LAVATSARAVDAEHRGAVRGRDGHVAAEPLGGEPDPQAAWAEYEEFARRGLSAFDVVPLFGEGIAERLHLGQPREAAQARLLRDDIRIDWQGNLECATERGPCGRAGAGSSAEGAPVRDTSVAK
jgi:hypothetical protein